MKWYLEFICSHNSKFDVRKFFTSIAFILGICDVLLQITGIVQTDNERSAMLLGYAFANLSLYQLNKHLAKT